ncbi:ParA family protein [Candidatus Woesearchaeota archaeon]|nr:ParA family protein [Candidatus Woesearchaeota archaeon]
MRKIAIFNQKGGVGKTTTAVNIAAGLSRNGKNVIIIDLDPQGDIEVCHKVSAKKDLSSVILNEADLEESITKLGKGLDIIHSTDRLAEAEESLIDRKEKIDILEKRFTPRLNYDYVILDCPPSLRFLNQSAFFYAKEIIIPSSTDVLGFDALEKTIKSVQTFNKKYSKSLLVSAIVPTMHDQRNKVCKHYLGKMMKEFTPLLVADPVRVNSKLKEAPRMRKSIFSYASKSSGAEDYWKLVKSVLENEHMYDSRFTLEQRKRAMKEYYVDGKKRELMIVGNKITFGFKFLTNLGEIAKEHLESKSVAKSSRA